MNLATAFNGGALLRVVVVLGDLGLIEDPSFRCIRLTSLICSILSHLRLVIVISSICSIESAVKFTTDAEKLLIARTEVRRCSLCLDLMALLTIWDARVTGIIGVKVVLGHSLPLMHQILLLYVIVTNKSFLNTWKHRIIHN